MAIHNDTCGCAECGNYGQVYNPKAIHNQSCGCPECGNYAEPRQVQSVAAQPAPVAAGSTSQERQGSVSHRAAKEPAAPEIEMVAVPVELLDEVRALIARRGAV